MNHKPILILSEQAEAYATELRRQSPDIELFSTLDEHSRSAEIVLGDPHILVESLGELSAVRWIQSTWAGVRPLIEQPRRDYMLTGVKGVFGEAIAEYALAYVLYLEKNIAPFVASQQAQSWQPLLPRRLRGKRLLVLGTGSIGQEIGRYFSFFGVEVTGMNREARATPSFHRCISPRELAEHLPHNDYIINILPDTPESRGLLDGPTLSLMKDDGIFINAGRGSVLDESAFSQHMQKGRLRAAVLDVFQQEPLPQGHPFWQQDRLLMSFHTAAPSFPEDIATLFLGNLEKYLAGKPLDHLVDFEKGY